jgi:hypothetical protein
MSPNVTFFAFFEVTFVILLLVTSPGLTFQPFLNLAQIAGRFTSHEISPNSSDLIAAVTGAF